MILGSLIGYTTAQIFINKVGKIIPEI